MSTLMLILFVWLCSLVVLGLIWLGSLLFRDYDALGKDRVRSSECIEMTNDGVVGLYCRGCIRGEGEFHNKHCRQPLYTAMDDAKAEFRKAFAKEIAPLIEWIKKVVK